MCSKWGDGLQLFFVVSSEFVDLCLLEDVVLFRSVITDLNCSLSGPYSKWSSIMKSKYIFIPSRTSASKVGLVGVCVRRDIVQWVEQWVWSVSPCLLSGCGNVLVVELAKEVLHTWFPWQPQQLAKEKTTPEHHKCPSFRGVPFI